MFATPIEAELVPTPFGDLEVERYPNLRGDDSFSTKSVSLASECGPIALSFHLDLGKAIPQAIRAVLAVGNSTVLKSQARPDQSFEMNGKAISWLVHLRMDPGTGSHAEELRATVRDHSEPRSENAIFPPVLKDPSFSSKIETCVRELFDNAFAADPSYLLRMRVALLKQHLQDKDHEVEQAETQLREVRSARDAAQTEIEAAEGALHALNSAPTP